MEASHRNADNAFANDFCFSPRMDGEVEHLQLKDISDACENILFLYESHFHQSADSSSVI